MPNFDKMEGRIKCVLMAAIQKEQRAGGHLAKEQEALRVEKTHQSQQLANGELTCKTGKRYSAERSGENGSLTDNTTGNDSVL